MINKDHFPALYNLAICYDSIAKFGCSLKYFKQAFELASNLNEAMVGACIVAIKTSDFEQAFAYLEQAIESL